MPLIHPKGIDNYKIFNNAPKFCYQHCIIMYKFILLYLGAIFQYTHDLNHKFTIDLLVICHFSFLDSTNLPKKCDKHVLVKLLLCTSMYIVFTFLCLCTIHLLCVILELSLKLFFKIKFKKILETFFLQWNGCKFSIHVLI
jgi:hypothetical protein